VGFARCLAGLMVIGGLGGEARGGELGTGGVRGLGGSSNAGGGLCAITVSLSGDGNREVGYSWVRTRRYWSWSQLHMGWCRCWSLQLRRWSRS
jgi:uncharacterized protein YidB (DUF937 family)